ncbi:MAG: LysR family transcriptional regulator [Bacteriovoracia bacterium]
MNQNLQAFLAVAELSSITAAAKRLGLGQTGATKRIRLLETELGVSLFTRSRKGMKLTGEGGALLRHCQDSRAREGRLLAELKKGGEEQEADLTLVGPASLIAGRFARQSGPIFKKWPKLNLRFVIDTNANRLSHLKRGTADLAILLAHEVTSELDSKRLQPLEYLMVATPKWKSRPFREILERERLFAYHPGDSTGLDYLKSFDCLAHLKRPRLYVNENQALQNFLTLGVGFGLLPRELAADLIHEEKLVALNQGRAFKIEVALAWYPRAEPPAYFQALVSAMQ